MDDLSAPPTVEPVGSVAPVIDEPQIKPPVVPPEDQKYFNAVIRQHKKRAETDSKTIKYFVNLFKNGQFAKGEGASANFTYSDVCLIMSTLLANNPDIVVTPKATGDLPQFQNLVMMGLFPDPVEAQEQYAKTLEDVETFVWKDTRSNAHLGAALFNGITTGLGYVKVSFDTDKQCSRIDALNRDEIFIDPVARYDISQASYYSHMCYKEIAEAKAWFAKKGMPPEDIERCIKGNFKLKEQTGLIADAAVDGEPDTDKPQYFRFFEVWLKKPTGERKVYYRNYDDVKADDASSDSWFFATDWPYQLDSDEFNLEAIVFNRQYNSYADAFTELAVVNGLRHGYENIVEFFRSHVHRAVPCKIIYNKSAFPMEDFEGMLDGDDFKAIPAILNDGQSMDDVLKRVTFTDDASNVLELANMMKSIKDEILGIGQLQRGGVSASKTAKQAEIEQGWTDTKFDRRQKVVDEAIQRILMIRLKIDLVLMPPEKVARIVGPQGQMLWDMFDGDMDELKCQYSVETVAGSTARDAQQEKVKNMEIMYKLMDATNQTQPMPVYDTPKLSREMLKLYGLPHPERFLLAPLQPKFDQMGMPMGGPMGTPPPPSGPPNGSNNQGPNGVGPGGNAPMQTLPGEREPGAGLGRGM